MAQTAVLGPAQSCDTWTAEKGGGGAKCATFAIAHNAVLSMAEILNLIAATLLLLHSIIKN